MAAMSFMEIIQASRRDLDDANGRQFRDQEIKGWAREAHLLVWSELITRVELYGAEETDITYPASTRNLDLATALSTADTVAKVHSVADVTNATDNDPGVYMEPAVYLDQFDGAGVASSTSTYGSIVGRQHYYVFGSPMQFGVFGPLPDETLTLRILWTPVPAAMADLSDTPAGVPEELHPAIVAGVVKLAKLRVGDQQGGQDARMAGYMGSALSGTTRRQNQQSRRVRIVDRRELLPGGRT